MIDAAVKALVQMGSPAFRSVLLKSVGLAVLLLALIAVGVHRMISWLAGSGQAWLEARYGLAHAPLEILLWFLAIAAGLGLVAGAVFLTPAVTALVASLFGDEIAEQVERVHYPAEPLGAAMPIARALSEGIRTALLAIGVYLLTVPFFLFAGLGLLAFFMATAYLLGREYFLLAAMRFHPAAQARALRKTHQATVFAGGLLIAAFVSIPIVNLAAPLFGIAFMVHLHKQLMGGPRPEILPPRERPPLTSVPRH